MKKIILCLMLLLTFVGNAAAVEPFDTQAGMAAYVNVGSLNLEDATEAYNQIYSLSTSHADGTINIGNNYGSDNIHVYVDTDGWIVAYVARDEELGHMIQWAGVDFNDPTFKTTFEDAISRMCSSIGVNYDVVQGNIKYYDFEHPQATNVLIFMNTVYGNDYTNILIPETYTIFNMNYSLFKNNYNYNSKLYIDGTQIRSCYAGNRALGHYDSNLLSKDAPHTLRLESGASSGAGVASILVYK